MKAVLHTLDGQRGGWRQCWWAGWVRLLDQYRVPAVHNVCLDSPTVLVMNCRDVDHL